MMRKMRMWWDFIILILWCRFQFVFHTGWGHENVLSALQWFNPTLMEPQYF